MITKLARFLIVFAVISTACTYQSQAQGVDKELGPVQPPERKAAIVAIDRFMSQKDVTNLIATLKNHDAEVKLHAVDAIKTLADTSVVPALINAWTCNQDVQTGGTGVRVLQEQLDQKLIDALAGLTNQTIDYSKPITREQMKNVIQASRNWANLHHMN